MLTVVLFCCVSAVSVQGQAIPQTKTAVSGEKSDDCADPENQMEMNLCSSEQYRNSDSRLNAIYSKVLEIMKGELAEARRRSSADLAKYELTAILKLKAAQRAWIQYRDLHCDAAGQQYEGGSMKPMVVAECLKQTTDHRIEEIKETYEIDRKLE